MWQPLGKVIEQYRRDLVTLSKKVFSAKIVTSSEFVDYFALQAAKRMVTGLEVENARNWREAAHKAMLGPVIAPALREEVESNVRIAELVRSNAALIKSIPQVLAKDVTAYTARRQQEGMRAEEVAKELNTYLPRLAKARIKLIARTEVSKASTALTQGRAEELGLDWYVWRTSKDQRVRHSHRLMDGVLIAWDNPASPEKLAGEAKAPAPYAPGNVFNCRCYPEPVLKLEQVSWPHKVYTDGRIKWMTRAKFSLLAA